MSRKNITVISFIIVFLGAVWMIVYHQKDRPYQEETYRFVFISKRLDEEVDFWTSMVEGLEMGAAEYRVELAVQGPESETMYAEQNRMIEQVIEQKPDAVLLAPSDYSMTLPYARAIEKAGIPLVLLDSVMEEEVGVCVVSTDNYEGGYKMGTYLRQYAASDSLIGIVSHMEDVSTASDRENGLRAGLAEYEQNIAVRVFCESDSEIAYRQTLQMLEQYPDMDLIAGLNEDAATGAAKAVQELGRAEEICLVGFDSSMEQVRFLEDGIFDAIVVQKPLNMGYLGIQAAYEAVRGKGMKETFVDSGSVLITSERIYTKENEKLLFPFRQGD